VQPKTRAGKFDWDEIELSYVEGKEDLFMYSREKTGNPKHPTLATLQAKYYERGWAKLREARITQQAVEAIGISDALQCEVVQVSLTARDQLMNANRMVERHLRVADATLGIVEFLDAKAIEALEFLDLKQMAMDDPARFIGALKIIQDMRVGAIEIQRKAMNLAGLKVEFVVNQGNDDQETLQRKMEALQSMDQGELLKDYMDSLKNAAG
jgi:hypothetical protein